MKRYLSVLFVLLLLWGLLTGCGGASKEMAMDAEAPMAPAATEAKPEEVLYDETASGTGNSSTALPVEQKLIRTVNMNAQTLDMEPLMTWIENQVGALNGYFEQKSIRRSGSRDDGSYYRYAELVIRIPAEHLDMFLSQVGEEANVTATSETTENVTLTYVSTQSRVQALETEQTRLLELLENAESMEDLLVIEERLTEVRWELDNYASQLRVLENQVSYSTVNLDIREVDKPTVLAERTVWQKISDGFSENTVDMWSGLVNAFVGILTFIPYLLPIGLVGCGIWLVWRWLRKLRKKHKKQKEA